MFSGSGRVKSQSLPSTTATSAAFASLWEILSARFNGVAPASYSSSEPSGSFAFITNPLKLYLVFAIY